MDGRSVPALFRSLEKKFRKMYRMGACGLKRDDIR
jgi:hypothetical protein